MGKLPSTKVTIIRAGGEEIPAEITASIIYENEEEVATMGIFFDTGTGNQKNSIRLMPMLAGFGVDNEMNQGKQVLFDIPDFNHGFIGRLRIEIER